MTNKVIIDGIPFEIEDEQQLEAEVDWNFPDEESAVKAVEAAIDCIEGAIEHLYAAEFDSPQLLVKPSEYSRDSLKKEAAFLAEIIMIVKVKK